MSREQLIRDAKRILGESNTPTNKKKYKQNRYKATKTIKKTEEIMDESKQILTVNPSMNDGRVSRGLDVILKQHKDALSVGDELLADTIMDQVYFLAFRDSVVINKK